MKVGRSMSVTLFFQKTVASMVELLAMLDGLHYSAEFITNFRFIKPSTVMFTPLCSASGELT